MLRHDCDYVLLRETAPAIREVEQTNPGAVQRADDRGRGSDVFMLQPHTIPARLAMRRLGGDMVVSLGFHPVEQLEPSG